MKKYILIMMLLVLSSFSLATESTHLRIGKTNVQEFIIEEPAEVTVGVHNNFDMKLKDLSAKIYIAEFDFLAIADFPDLKSNKGGSASLILEFPEDVESGYYYARITVSNDDVRRTKYREIYVE